MPDSPRESQKRRLAKIRPHGLVCAVIGFDVLDEPSDVSPCVFDRPFLCLPHPMFDRCEGLFDRVEIGGIGRQIPEASTGRVDCAPHSCRLVAAEIVHHDDVAFAQGRRKLLLDIGAETFAVDRPVGDTGRAVSWSQRSAPRKVSVRQWPCGAKPRRRLPFAPRRASAPYLS
jgi:hypothetical protein